MRVDPVIPGWWKRFSLRYRHGEAIYEIQVENPDGREHGVSCVEMDGRRLPDKVILLERVLVKHRVLVRVGDSAQAMRTVRPPAPAESGIVAELVLQSDCGMLPALFGDNVKALICHLQTIPSYPYSAENTLVMIDEAHSPSVVGALLGSLARVVRSKNLRTAALLCRWYGPQVVARFPTLARAGKALDSLEPEDYYLSHIAVLPEHRGRGLGRELLIAGEEHARYQGAHRLALDVEEHNEGARSFYTRLEYRAESVIRIDLARRGMFSFVRLFKAL